MFFQASSEAVNQFASKSGVPEHSTLALMAIVPCVGFPYFRKGGQENERGVRRPTGVVTKEPWP